MGNVTAEEVYEIFQVFNKLESKDAHVTSGVTFTAGISECVCAAL